ncbi:Lrp/AsnC family transcriptional regulator [Desulfofalx alkaliphila]|uniref:siroheme decarboxylase subunit beta n=1 Tax=Desulfofalx alkaliphila TaxID=105483 RepID=UPI0004E0C206|nr:Lrp/AsnC family transcriptional regulator [Desulfofalx alkaliphila]
MLTKLEKNIIKELQKGLPLVPQPFAHLGEKLGLTEKELLEIIDQLMEKGYMKRMGAALRHHRVGFVANAMVVWQVPEDMVEEVGNKLAAHPEVTHCYQRKTYPHWKYNFYTMIHRQSREECYDLAEELSRLVGIKEYKLLFSTKELKKSSMAYFADEK